MRSPALRRAALTSAGILALLAIYLLRLDDIAGVINDDAWYLVLAKAIAQGDGPRLISSAGTAFLSNVYPPGFPFILSLVFRISPEFPGNLMLLKGVSVAAMFGAGALLYLYATRYRGVPGPLALVMAVALLMTPAFVFLATSTLMSEPVFLCLQLAAVLAIERAARTADDAGGRGAAVLAGLLTAAAVLTRTAGVTLGAAGVLYFLYLRRWRAAVVFALVTACGVLPWSLHARANAPTQAELIDHGGLMARAYADQFWTSEAGTVTAREVGIDGLPARVVGNAINITIRDIGGIFTPLLFRTPSESGTETFGLGPPEGLRVPSMGGALGTKIVSAVLTALALVGFIIRCRRGLTVAEPLVVLALGMIVLWPFWTFRFVLPLVPFLLIYLATGVGAIASPAAARIFLLVLIGLNVLDHAEFIARAQGSPRSVVWRAQGDDIAQVFDWIRRETPPGSIIAADNPALVYLRTGRRTVAINSLDDRSTRWQRLGVRYVVSISDGEPPTDPRAALRFKHPHRNIWVYELLPGSPPAPSISMIQSPDRDVLSSTR